MQSKKPADGLQHWGINVNAVTTTYLIFDLCPPKSTRGPIYKKYSFFYWVSTEKLKQSQQKQTCIHNKTYYDIKLTLRKLKIGLVGAYDLRPGNGTSLFRKK